MAKSIYNIIISIIIIEITPKKIIEIPFKVSYSELKKDILNYMSMMYNSTIITEIEIGTPLNKFNASIYLQSYYSIILSNQTNHLSRLFNQKLSSTYKSIETINTFINEPMDEFEFGEDIIKIGNINLNKLKFALAKRLNYNYDYIISSTGIIGLRLKETFENQDFPNYTLLHQLKENKLIDNNIFRFDFTSQEKGKLIIGETIKENENYIKIPVGKFPQIEIDQTWGFNFDNIKYGNYSINKYTNALLEVNIEFIVGTNNFINITKKEFFNQNKDKCSEKQTLVKGTGPILYFECEKNIDLSKVNNLVFEIKNINFSFILEPKDLFIDFEDKKFFVITYSINSNFKWIFGRYFLQKYSLYFDKDKKIIGVFQKSKFSFKSILLLLISIFLIIIIGGLMLIIFRLLKKRRRKRACELDDEFDYMTKEMLNNK